MRRAVVITICLLAALLAPAHAKWTWNPLSGWVNPKDAPLGTPSAQYKYAEKFYEDGDFKQAAVEFEKLVEEYPFSRYAPRAQFMAGESHFKAGDYYAAYEAYQALQEQFPQSKQMNDAIEREYEIGDLFCAGAKKNIPFVDLPNPLPAGSTGVAILRKVIENDRYGRLADDAAMRIGDYYLDQGDYKQAREEYDLLVEDYPDGDLAETARYKRALAHAREFEGGNYDPEPAKEFRIASDVIMKTGGSPERSEEIERLITEMDSSQARSDWETARFYLKNQKAEAAAIYLRSIIKHYPDTDYAEKARTVLDVLQPDAP